MKMWEEDVRPEPEEPFWLDYWPTEIPADFRDAEDIEPVRTYVFSGSSATMVRLDELGNPVGEAVEIPVPLVLRADDIDDATYDKEFDLMNLDVHYMLAKKARR